MPAAMAPLFLTKSRLRPTLKTVRTTAQDLPRVPISTSAARRRCSAKARPAGVMMVGEQPGDAEDLAGHPFVGPAGKLLDRALAEAGIDRGPCLRDQRRETLQVGAARQAADPHEAERRGDRAPAGPGSRPRSRW